MHTAINKCNEHFSIEFEFKPQQQTWNMVNKIMIKIQQKMAKLTKLQKIKRKKKSISKRNIHKILIKKLCDRVQKYNKISSFSSYLWTIVKYSNKRWKNIFRIFFTFFIYFSFDLHLFNIYSFSFAIELKCKHLNRI